MSSFIYVNLLKLTFFNEILRTEMYVTKNQRQQEGEKDHFKYQNICNYFK